MLLAALALATAGAAPGCSSLEGQRSGSVVVRHASVVGPGFERLLASRGGGYAPDRVTVPLCRVEGTIEGNIGFELWLPQPWNGRLLGAGVGGDAGVYNYRDLSIRVNQGFAAVTTDSGHKITDQRWMASRKSRVDYEHRAVHLTALAAKDLVTAYYSHAPSASYFLGCSGGGRQALKEMQDYPSDYDGVVAGAPGPYMPLLSVRMMWFALQQKHNPAAALSDADWSLYERAATASCDRNDGVADGIIENPLACHFRIARLGCKQGQTTGCLAPAKLSMLEAIVSPMPDEHGRPMDKGLLPGVRTRPGPPSPLLRAMWGDAVYDDPNWNEDSFQRTADLKKVDRAMPELRADRTDIEPFIRRGGKALIYQGWADPSVNAGPTADYYAQLAAKNGGASRLERSVRLFMVPGMFHCRGGPGADAFGGSGHPAVPEPDPNSDILWALINWVEKGIPPKEITSAKIDKGLVKFTRKLCAYPQSAVYDGRGNPNQASSYACRNDNVLERQMIKAK